MRTWGDIIPIDELGEEWVGFLNKIDLRQEENNQWSVNYKGERTQIEFAIVQNYQWPGIAIPLGGSSESGFDFLSIPGLRRELITRGLNEMPKRVWEVWEE